MPEGEEENIYEVMKAHMRRQKEELEAKNAAAKASGGKPLAGRPGPVRPAAPPAPPPVELVKNLGDMAAVWEGARNWLGAHARYLESVLGHCCGVTSIDRETGEAVVRVPVTQRGFTNEKARTKIEEALRAVTGLGLKVVLAFSEEVTPPPAPLEAGGGQTQASRRIPPEVEEAVKQQPVIQKLMKALDAHVTQIEMVEGEDGN